MDLLLYGLRVAGCSGCVTNLEMGDAFTLLIFRTWEPYSMDAQCVLLDIRHRTAPAEPVMSTQHDL